MGTLKVYFKVDRTANIPESRVLSLGGGTERAKVSELKYLRETGESTFVRHVPPWTCVRTLRSPATRGEPIQVRILAIPVLIVSGLRVAFRLKSRGSADP